MAEDFYSHLCQLTSYRNNYWRLLNLWRERTSSPILLMPMLSTVILKLRIWRGNSHSDKTYIPLPVILLNLRLSTWSAGNLLRKGIPSSSIKLSAELFIIYIDKVVSISPTFLLKASVDPVSLFCWTLNISLFTEVDIGQFGWPFFLSQVLDSIISQFLSS